MGKGCRTPGRRGPQGGPSPGVPDQSSHCCRLCPAASRLLSRGEGQSGLVTILPLPPFHGEEEKPTGGGGSEEEEEPPPAERLPSSQPRLPLFPGLDPSALKVRLGTPSPIRKAWKTAVPLLAPLDRPEGRHRLVPWHGRVGLCWWAGAGGQLPPPLPIGRFPLFSAVGLGGFLHRLSSGKDTSWKGGRRPPLHPSASHPKGPFRPGSPEDGL